MAAMNSLVVILSLAFGFFLFRSASSQFTATLKLGTIEEVVTVDVLAAPDTNPVSDSVQAQMTITPSDSTIVDALLAESAESGLWELTTSVDGDDVKSVLLNSPVVTLSPDSSSLVLTLGVWREVTMISGTENFTGPALVSPASFFGVGLARVLYWKGSNLLNASCTGNESTTLQGFLPNLNGGGNVAVEFFGFANVGDFKIALAMYKI